MVGDAACIIANCAEELLDVLPLRIDVFLGKPGNRKSSLVAINNLFPMLGNAVAHVVSGQCPLHYPRVHLPTVLASAAA